MKLENLTNEIENARKDIAMVNLLTKKISSISAEELPEGFSEELEKSINNLSKMILALEKELGYKTPYNKYSEKDGITFFRGNLNLKENFIYESELFRAIGVLNKNFDLLSKFNDEDNKRQYQRIVKRDLSFLELKKPYFTAHGKVIDSLAKAISLVKTSVEDKEEGK